MAAPLYLVSSNAPNNSLLPVNLLNDEFPALELYHGQHANLCAFRERYFECTQHDFKAFDWQGRTRSTGRPNPATQPLLANTQLTQYVPLDQRRPSSPYRIGVTIVSQFTSLVFGEHKFPEVVSDDPNTKDFFDQLVKETGLKTKMVLTRNRGGNSGTACLSWTLDDGKVRIRTHASKNCHVIEWEDPEEFIPRHVVELYQTQRLEFDQQTRKHVLKWYWFRRDWTPDAEISFLPVLVTKENPTQWTIDTDTVVEHNMGKCRFIWIQNMPRDDDADGFPDYEGLYEQMDELDILNSVNTNGVKKNLDPTLVLKLGENFAMTAGLSKGSDNALDVGPTGDAKYLELSGTAATIGKLTIDQNREQVLEVAQCVVPDPDKVVSAGTSGRSLERLYGRSLDKAGIFRTQYGKGLVQLFEQIAETLRELMPADGSPVEIPVYDDETGEPTDVTEQVHFTVQIKPRVETRPIVGEDGQPTGDVETITVPRHPGKGFIGLEWPKFFEDTADDEQKEASAVGSSNGGKPFVSQRTSVERWAKRTGVDPDQEMARILEEEERANKNAIAQFGGALPDAGGSDPETNEAVEEES